MARFIFYTEQGYTVAPNGKDLDNLQVLGLEDGLDEKEATNKLFKNNTWILENGFLTDKIKCYTVFSTDFLSKMNEVVEYLWEDEEKHSEESECPEEHIFQVISQVKKQL